MTYKEFIKTTGYTHISEAEFNKTYKSALEQQQKVNEEKEFQKNYAKTHPEYAEQYNEYVTEKNKYSQQQYEKDYDAHLQQCSSLGEQAADLTTEYLSKEKEINSLKQANQDNVDNGKYSQESADELNQELDQQLAQAKQKYDEDLANVYSELDNLKENRPNEEEYAEKREEINQQWENNEENKKYQAAKAEAEHAKEAVNNTPEITENSEIPKEYVEQKLQEGTNPELAAEINAADASISEAKDIEEQQIDNAKDELADAQEQAQQYQDAAQEELDAAQQKIEQDVQSGEITQDEADQQLASSQSEYQGKVDTAKEQLNDAEEEYSDKVDAATEQTEQTIEQTQENLQDSSAYEQLEEDFQNDEVENSAFVNDSGVDASTYIADVVADSDVSPEETVEVIANDEINQLTQTEDDVEITIPAEEPSEEEQRALAEKIAKQMYQPQDPRIFRKDEFLMGVEGNPDGISLPFGTKTVASAFAMMNFTVEKAFAEELAQKHQDLPISSVLNSGSGTNSSAGTAASESTNAQGPANKDSNSTFAQSLPNSTKVIVGDPTPFENNPNNFGVQSIVNPFSLTKLMGGLDDITENGAANYMFDIRDKRRFYGISVEGNDVHAVNNPTVTQLIQWSNNDLWGRTPYSFQDFVFCKHFGLIQNNRLLTLRRYHAPTYDNLQFESMFGAQENNDGTTNEKSSDNINNKVFSPHATVVSYFGGDTGNTLSSLMNFTTGILWDDVTAKIHEVNGDEGSDPQQVIDKMFENGGFGGAENDTISKGLSKASTISAKIMSYGKFALAFNGEVGAIDDDAMLKQLYSANNDPYGSNSIFQNRVLGPINRIDSVKKRKPGIDFSQSLSIKCSYKAKSIGGINPKAAILDVLGNCMEMVSPTAVFWGGGHKFMVEPHVYPYHDGGWRDNFMKKIYDGKFLGSDGAIATALSGMKKIAQKDGSGELSWDNVKDNLGSVAGDGLGMIGSALSSISSMFGGSDFLESAANLLTGAGSEASGKTEQQVKDDANKKLNTLFGNLQTMWHSKVLKQSTLPRIESTGALLIGDPVGEWHLTVGNPLNPIMVIGNLICNKMDVAWDEELGPDDFPTGFTVTYNLEHGMQRDKDAIQSMFNRGMGRYYVLPDYMQCSSDRITYVDKFTKNAGTGDTGTMKYLSTSYIKDATAEFGTSGYQTRKIDQGSKPKNSGNPNTQLVTKFTPINTKATATLNQIRSGNLYQGGANLAVIKSLAATRKHS